VTNTHRNYQVRSRVRLFRWLFRPIFRMIFHLLSRVRIIGKENIPASGAYLIAINHISLFEPPFVLAFWPIAPEAVGAQEIWERRMQSSLARFYGGIPVRRGEYDRRLLDTMVGVLNSGRPLLIAPEGGRSHTPGMGQALPGVAYVVSKANIPVIPVGIVGSTEDFLKKALRGERPTLEMRVGKPVYLPEITVKGEKRRLVLKQNTDLIMYKIASLLPPEYQGVYGNRDFHLAETA
jgi:1-acyl-sn-glycerol-3-phosphate acyltransferase